MDLGQRPIRVLAVDLVRAYAVGCFIEYYLDHLCVRIVDPGSPSVVKPKMRICSRLLFNGFSRCCLWVNFRRCTCVHGNLLAMLIELHYLYYTASLLYRPPALPAIQHDKRPPATRQRASSS